MVEPLFPYSYLFIFAYLYEYFWNLHAIWDRTRCHQLYKRAQPMKFTALTLSMMTMCIILITSCSATNVTTQTAELGQPSS